MKQYQASSLVVSLMVLGSILLLVFINKDNLNRQERITQSYYQRYLTNKLNLYNRLKERELDKICQENKQVQDSIYFNKFVYSFACHSLLDDLRKNRTKYIQINKDEQRFDFAKAQTDIYYINDLREFPESDLENPKIVIANNSLVGELEKDFYGIVITDYLFQVTGKRIYGILYSRYNNINNLNNISYKKEVILNLQNKYWHYQPYSRSLLGND